jgi:hypothetical protein
VILRRADDIGRAYSIDAASVVAIAKMLARPAIEQVATVAHATFGAARNRSPSGTDRR